jgi:hypothetical protein
VLVTAHKVLAAVDDTPGGETDCRSSLSGRSRARTFEDMNDNWQAAAPILVNYGYCVFAFNYGGSSPNADFRGTGETAASTTRW